MAALKHDQQISKSNFLTSFIIFIRVQYNTIIRYHFSRSHHLDVNGEDLVVNTLAPICNHFFDIGANKGEYAEKLIATNKSAQFYLYEPSVEAGGLLLRKFSGFENVVINQKALGDLLVTMTFTKNPVLAKLHP